MSASSRSDFVMRRLEQRSPANVWVVAEAHSSVTNELLVGALHERGVSAELVPPAKVSGLACFGDIVLGRLDVRPTLDGVEDGIWELRRVERSGVHVLNPAPSLVACHDKLQTVLRLAGAGVPQPATSHIDWCRPPGRVDVPVVVKPRFGSWGKDVFLCESQAELEQCLRQLRRRGWFRRQGALVQAYVPSLGFDLRVVVAGGEVVGAVQRVAPAGEWRTNIALGGCRRPVTPPAEACVLATAAAAAVEGDLVGVDLLPLAAGRYVVLEVNGAVDFTSEYSLAGRDVFDAVAMHVVGGATALDVRAAELGG
jgi:[lysine-biosynthesis-protein LysW]--L-2-aminoadipate ligase